MNKSKPAEVLLWTDTGSGKTGFIVKIEEGKYSIVARRPGNENVDAYPGTGRVIKVDPEIIYKLEMYFTSHGIATMPSDLSGIVEDVLRKI